MSAEQSTESVPDDDGPECETCGKTTCPDADLPGFSEPVRCLYAPICRALKDSKDCDYGCSRDYTNQAVRLWVVEAVEQIVAAARADERERTAESLRGAFSGDEYEENAEAAAGEGEWSWFKCLAVSTMERDNTPAQTEEADRG